MVEVTNIPLSVQEPNINVVVHAKQNDRASRKIRAKLTDGAQEFIPPANAHFVVRYMKADGNGGMYDTLEDGTTPAVTMSGNVATIGIAEQMLTTQGIVSAELNIYDQNETRLSTFMFTVLVEASVMEDEEIESTEYFNILTQEIAVTLEAAKMAEAVIGMTVDAEKLSADENPEVETEYDPEEGTLNVHFGIPAGNRGKSAYETAEEAGYEGSEATFNSALGDITNIVNTAEAAKEAAEQAKTDVEDLAESISGSVGIDDDVIGLATTWSSKNIARAIRRISFDYFQNTERTDDINYHWSADKKTCTAEFPTKMQVTVTNTIITEEDCELEPGEKLILKVERGGNLDIFIRVTWHFTGGTSTVIRATSDTLITVPDNVESFEFEVVNYINAIGESTVTTELLTSETNQELSEKIIALEENKVDKTTKVNGKTLNDDILLDASDINVDETAEEKVTIAAELSSQSSQIAQLDTLKADKTALTAEVARLTAVNARQDKSIEFLSDAIIGVQAKKVTDSTEAYSKAITAYPQFTAKMADIKSIGGKSVVWNQLFDYTQSPSSERNGITFTSNNDGTYTCNGTSTGDAYSVLQIQVILGHKYFLKSLLSAGSLSTFYAYCTVNMPADNRDFGNGAIVEATGTGNTNFVICFVQTGVTVNNLRIKPQLIDLTQLYGSGSEPTTTSDPRILAIEAYLADHPEYNAGEIISADCKSVNSNNHVLKGNIQTGTYNSSGVYQETSGAICTIEKLQINPGTVLTVKYTESCEIDINRYRSDGSSIAATQRTGVTELTETMGSTTTQVNISVRSSGITLDDFDKITVLFNGVEQKNIIAQMSIPPALREAHPLRSVGNVHDSLTFSMVNGSLKVEHHQKTEIVDLGSLEFIRVNDYANKPLFLVRIDEIHNSNIICGKYNYVNPYILVTTNGMKGFAFSDAYYVNKNIMFADNTYSDAESFRAAMQNENVKLIFEKSEEVVTDVTSFFPADFSNVLTIEDGGSLTFEQTATEFAIPNSEDIYYVKTQEVTE